MGKGWRTPAKRALLERTALQYQGASRSHKQPILARFMTVPTLCIKREDSETLAIWTDIAWSNGPATYSDALLIRKHPPYAHGLETIQKRVLILILFNKHDRTKRHKQHPFLNGLEQTKT